MANFDDNSIFKRNTKPEQLEENEELDDAVQEEVADIDEDSLEEENTIAAKVIGEEFVESEKARKLREKKEKREKKLQDKQYAIMVKNHRKAMKNNPENIKRYDTDIENGLPDAVVDKRILDNLVNTTKTGSTKSKKMIIFSNIFTFFNMLTISIAIWLITVQAFTDLVFLIIVLMNSIIGIIQEIKAKNAIDRLSLLSAPSAVVIRAGVQKEINISDVVLDDLLVLNSGNQICADCILVSGTVEVNESLLTGESNAIIKNPGDLLFSGSYVVSGRCRARVDKVGSDKYIEKLSNQAKQYLPPNSELLKALKRIIIFMAVLIIPIGIALFCLQTFSSGIDYVTAVRKTAGAMVGMIPSGLWLLTSVALYVGVLKLSQKNVLVQELYCIEMLARINVLCLDKTGTITDGTMSVKNTIDYNTLYGLSTKNIVSAMLNALNESNLTSVALEEKFGLNKRIKHLATIPFSSQRKFNAVTFDKMGTFALGAPEFVLKKHFEQIRKEVEKNAGLGYRVLCLAHFNGTISDNKLPDTEPEIISLILIEDNIRPDAINTINYFKQSGVSVRVISGDNPLTVAKISERAGIDNATDYISLDGLSDAEVERAALKYTVFGRVSPSQKKLLVTTLKAAGKKVAMTGDGVNDILALREADCSIAIASGSEAARNVSHLVLLDSNFDSMPKVVSEGRRVINNVTGVASLFLTKTIFSLLLAIQAMNSGGAYPISTNQLIIIDLFAIGIPSFFLVMEPNNKEVEGNFLLNIIKGALPGALTILIISLTIFGLSDSLNLDTISIQTIICIAATHTCLMVLFKVCKPLNNLRKTICILCYSAFIIIVVLLPQFLEFRPIVGFSEYYSSTIKEEKMTFVPEIRLSDDYYYVYNGRVTEYQKVAAEKNIVVTSVYQNDKYYYAFNGTNVKEEVIIPELSFLPDGSIVVGGTEVFYKENEEKQYIKYEENYQNNFTIDSEGYVLYKGRNVMRTLTETNEYYNFYNKYGQNKTEDVKICIMPIVELKNDQLVITPVISSLNSTTDVSNKTYKTSITSQSDIHLSINSSTMELLVNDLPVAPTLEDGTISSNTYKVEVPSISINENQNIMINGLVTSVNVSSFGIESLIDDNQQIADTSDIEILPYDASYYILSKNNPTVSSGFNSDVKLSNPLISPDITTTESGYYIIDGYYTNYLSISPTPDPKIDSEYNLILGGVVTDYKISSNTIQTTTGGIVKSLSVAANIFLLMLCLISVPLMRLLQAIIPWIKRQVELVQKILAKL